MIKERLSILICWALLVGIPSSVFAAKDGISVTTIYFADGTSQSTAMLQGPAGPQGPTGPEGPQGQTGPAGLQGSTGAAGYNSLLLVTDETSGSNCANGGTKIQVGLDQDRSGVLDCGEVLQTKYICNGTTPGTPSPGTITVTASPSTQTVNSFANITATLPAGNYYGGNVNFTTSGSCTLYDPNTSSFNNYINQNVSPGGIASVAVTSSSNSGASVPCVVYANYYDYNKQVNYSGSALATFVTESGTTPVTPPPPITVTASPSTQTVNSFVNITATLTPGNYYGNVYFTTSGSCMLYDATNNSYNNYASQSVSPGGIASVALTSNSNSGASVPCIVYADYYDYNKQVNFSSSALATFVPQAP